MRTILGLIPKYQGVDQLLQVSNNVALHVSLYKADSTTLNDLRKILLIIRRIHVKDL